MKSDILKHLQRYELLYVICIDVLICFVYAFAIVNFYHSNQSFSQSIIDERTKQVTILEKGSYLASENIKIDAMTGDKKVIDENFIPKNELLSFITTLEQKAEENHLASSLDLDDVDQQQTNIQNVDLKISLQGSYIDFMQYIRTLEILPYYINIKNIQITNENSNNSKEGLVLNIQAQTYWY